MAGARPLFSQDWHRAAGLKPQLRPHVRIERHSFGGEVWHVLQDELSHRHYRLSAPLHALVARMDGRTTLETLWFRTAEQLGDDAPTQDETLQLLGQLYAADALVTDAPPDTDEIVARARRQRRQRRIALMKSPLSIRVPLFDPDPFLTRTARFVTPLFSRAGFVVWFAFVLYGAILAAMHWEAFTTDFADRVLAADNLFLLWLTFPVVKALHELGHGYAVKKWGGEVHEIGVMFLVFVPVPYVDAAGSAVFREKWKRAVVGAAGMMAELPVAALAMIVWTEAEPGLVKALAYNTVLITGVSTLLFNGNPLLRYDGYYILSDLTETPNLAQRANRYVQHLLKTRLLGMSPTDETWPEGRRWLFSFAILSFLYRLVVWASILLLVASKFFVIGALLALWSMWTMFGAPLLKAATFLGRSPALAGGRERALRRAGYALAALCFLFLVAPAPLAVVVDGVVWTPERSEIRAGRDGVVADVFAAAGDATEPDAAIARIDDPLIEAEYRIAELRLREIDLQYRAALASDPFAAGMLREEIEDLKERLARAREKVDALTVRAKSSGRLVSAQTSDLPGQYLRRGDLVGYVRGEGGLIVMAVVPAEDIALVRNRNRGAEIRLDADPMRTLRARIVRLAPQASRVVPNRALAKDGGGRLSLDPSASARGAPTSLEEHYYLELTAEGLDDAPQIGGRARVRLDLGLEPVAFQAARKVRQVFLERLNV